MATTAAAVEADKRQQHALALQHRDRKSMVIRSGAVAAGTTNMFNFSMDDTNMRSVHVDDGALAATDSNALNVSNNTSPVKPAAAPASTSAAGAFPGAPPENGPSPPMSPAAGSHRPALSPAGFHLSANPALFSSFSATSAEVPMAAQLVHGKVPHQHQQQHFASGGNAGSSYQTSVVATGGVATVVNVSSAQGGDVTHRSYATTGAGSGGGHRKGSSKTGSATATAGYSEQKMRGLALQLRRRSANSSSRDQSHDAGRDEEKVDYLERVLQRGAETAPINVRVGVHGGMVNVGNMGCVQRLSYTCLGDAVNTASRLEGFVKHMEGPCEIICGAAVVNEAHPAILARYVGPVRLVGKHDTIEVCQVLGAALLTADETYALIQRRPVPTGADGGSSSAPVNSKSKPDDTPTTHRLDGGTTGATSASGTGTVAGGFGTQEAVKDADRAVTSFLAGAIGGFDAAYDSHVLDAVATFNHYVRVAHAAAAELREAKRHPRQHHLATPPRQPPVTTPVASAAPPLSPTLPTLMPGSTVGAFGSIDAGNGAATAEPRRSAQINEANRSEHHPTAPTQHERYLETALDEAVAAVHAAYEDIPLALRLLFAMDDSLACLRSHSGAIECDSK
jgi:hypothetical protein